MKKILLWIDDYRDPHENDWIIFSPIGKNCKVVWTKSYIETINWLKYNWPYAICFDHDLNENKTGYNIALYVVNEIINNNKSIPKIDSQSANNIGKENIFKLFNNLNKYIKL